MPTGPRFEGGRRQAWREDQAAKRGQPRAGTPGPDRPDDARSRDDRPRDDRPRDDASAGDRPRDDDRFARPRDDDRFARPRDDRPREDRLNDDRPRDFVGGDRGDAGRAVEGRGEPGRFTGNRDRPGQGPRPDRFAGRDRGDRSDGRDRYRDAGQERDRDDRRAGSDDPTADTGYPEAGVTFDPRPYDADDRRPGIPDGIRDSDRDRSVAGRPDPWRADRDSAPRRDQRGVPPDRDERGFAPGPGRDREQRPAATPYRDDRPARYADPGDRSRDRDRDRDRDQPQRPFGHDERAGQFRGQPDRGAPRRDDRSTPPRPDDRWQGDRQDRPVGRDSGFAPGPRPAPDRARSRDDSRWEERPAPRRDDDRRPGIPGGARGPSPRDARYLQGRAAARDDGASASGPDRPNAGAPDRPRVPRSARTTGSPKADADALLARLGVGEASFADQYGAVQIYARKAGKSLPNGLRSDLRRRGLLARRGNGRPMESASLADVRAHIDRVDQQLVEILVERGAYVAQAAAFKTDAAAVADPARVETVIANARRHAEGWATDPSLVEDLYRAMIPVFIAHETDTYEAGPATIDDTTSGTIDDRSDETDSDMATDGTPDEGP